MKNKDYKYVFGPIASRRLGRSLGISPIPSKTCNYACVYCQLGKTTNFTNERKAFFPVKEIIKEVKDALKQEKQVDYVTIVGEGEPTLYKELGKLIKEIKKVTGLPLAVITNGALFYDEEVRGDLMKADVVLPTLDASTEKIWKRVNRPHKDLDFERVTEGLKTFSQEYNNQLWLEVMLVKDLNDSEEVIKGIRKIIDEIRTDKIFINVPIRPPAVKNVEIPETEKLQQAQDILDADSIAHYEELLIESVDKDAKPEEQILSIVKRHPLRNEQIYALFPEMKEEELVAMLEKMQKEKKIERHDYHKKSFWKLAEK